MGLSKHRRLRRREEFRRALREGNRARDALLSITAVISNHADAEALDRESTDIDARYGFAIPKRVGGAVVRNRIKRRLKAIVGTSDRPTGWDFVIYAFPAAADATYAQLTESVNRLTRRAMRPRSARRKIRNKRS